MGERRTTPISGRRTDVGDGPSNPELPLASLEALSGQAGADLARDMAGDPSPADAKSLPATLDQLLRFLRELVGVLGTEPVARLARELANLRREEPLLIDTAQLAKLLDVSEATVERLDASGKLPTPVRIGGSKKWQLRGIHEWVGRGCPDRATWDALQGDGPTSGRKYVR